MKPSALAFLLVCALAVVPAGASGAAIADERGLLLVNYFFGSGSSNPWISIDSVGPIAKVTLSAPAGYPMRLDHPPGTRLGIVSSSVSPVGGGSLVPVGGTLVVESPARYASDPTAQACAPGAHTAVWAVTLSGLAQSLELPIFVDWAGAGSAAVLRFCPSWQTPGGAMSVRTLAATIDGVFGELTARGMNTWRALVSPPLPSLAPDEARTFELRAHEPVPHRVTVQGRYDERTRTAVLSGKLTAVGRPERRATVTFLAVRERASTVLGVGTATTDVAGRFSFRHRTRRSTAYIAQTEIDPRACGEPSSAPAGCAGETVAAPPLAFALVRVRRPTEAKLVVRSRDRALAGRIDLKLGDLPAHWRPFSFFSSHRCRAFNPRLTALTATGWAESWEFERRDATASSRVTVYVSKEQARIAFDREARLAAAQCLADELRRDSSMVSVRALRMPVLGDERRGFRLVAQDGNARWNVDLVSFRQGRAVVHLGFTSVLPRVRHAVAAKLAARARRG